MPKERSSRVFPDKDAVVQAVLQAAMDPEPTERELAAIDRSLPFEEQLIEAVCIMQRRIEQHLAAALERR